MIYFIKIIPEGYFGR